MNCKHCQSDRIARVMAKCNDLCVYYYRGRDSDGYVPPSVGLGRGDAVEFSYCLDCGQIQGEFPIDEEDALAAAGFSDLE